MSAAAGPRRERLCIRIWAGLIYDPGRDAVSEAHDMKAVGAQGDSPKLEYPSVGPARCKNMFVQTCVLVWPTVRTGGVIETWMLLPQPN